MHAIKASKVLLLLSTRKKINTYCRLFKMCAVASSLCCLHNSGELYNKLQIEFILIYDELLFTIIDDN